MTSAQVVKMSCSPYYRQQWFPGHYPHNTVYCYSSIQFIYSFNTIVVIVYVLHRYRIGPFEVESALIEHPAVAESAVVSSPDTLRGEVRKIFPDEFQVF